MAVRKTVAEVGDTVTEGVSIIRVLLIPKDELTRTRALELGETVATVRNTAVEFFNISLDFTIPLVLIRIVKLCDFNVEVTKLEFKKGALIVGLPLVVDITVPFRVNIAVVSKEVDFRTVPMFVGIKLLVFIKLLSADVTVLKNVTLVFETATKRLALDSKMVEERKIDLLLGERNEEVLVTLLLKLGTTEEEFATSTVDGTIREETITCVVFDEKLLRGETDEFPSRVTALVRAEDLSCVLEGAVEFTRTSELAGTVTNVVFGNFVKLRLKTELGTTLEN